MSGLPSIKILDFGLARITDTDMVDPTVLTEVGMIKGTLPYMSPEQARGQADSVDVRTDVYALGVILYEMLSGKRPYNVDKSALLEAVRVICEEPPQPIRKTLEGTIRLDPDVETILNKALDKDPERRYANAANFSEDIERFLTSQPILARPPSAAYQLKKFASRNRGLVTAAAVVAVALIVGLIGTTLGFRQARREARRSERVAQLVTDMLHGVRPQEAQGMDTTLLRRILEDASSTVEETLAEEPEVAAQMRQTIGVTYSSIGDNEAAEPHILAGLELTAASYGDNDPRTLTARATVATHRGRQGRLAEAEQLHREVYEERRRILGEDHTDTRRSQRDLAIVYMDSGRSNEAVPLLEDILDYHRRVGEEDTNDHLVTQNSLAVAHLNLRNLGEAEPRLIEALEHHRKILGDDHPNTIRVVHNLAGLYAELSRFDEAIALHEQAHERLERVLGENHPVTLRAAGNFAAALLEMNRPAEAEPLIEDVLARQRELFGPEHTSTLKTLKQLAHLRVAQRNPAEADRLFQEILASRREVQGDDHYDTLQSIRDLALFYMNFRLFDRALPLYLELVETARSALGDDHPSTLGYIHQLALLHMRMLEYEQAEAAYLEAIEGRRRVLGEAHSETLVSMNSLGVMYMQQERYDAAEPLLTEALAGQRTRLGDGHQDTLITFFNLGWIHYYSDDYEEALEMFEAARAGFVALFGEEHGHVLIAGRAAAMTKNELERWDEVVPEARAAIALAQKLGNGLEESRAWRTLGSAQLGGGDPVAAEAAYRKGLEVTERVQPAGHHERAEATFRIGQALVAQERWSDAEPLLLDAAERLLADTKAPPSSVKRAIEHLVDLYERFGQPENAARWREHLPG